MVKYRIALMLLTFAALSSPVLADTDPSMHDVYVAAEGGHLDQAQQMMTQVLRDHPRSAKAHYVAAEIYARQGNASLARVELNVAEQIEPGLPFATPQAVRALKAQLGSNSGAAGLTTRPTPQIPWGVLLIGLVVVGGIFLMLRRRRAPVYGGVPAMGGAPGYPGPAYGAPGYGPGAAGGGIGSGIAGGLASGLAVGAGVVAGEELAHHFLDGRRETIAPAEEAPSHPVSNGDMGGSDFGVTEDPSSWDDSGSSGGDGGGGDWS
jgi:hypothetical protein